MTDKEAMATALDALQFALHVGFDESSESQIKKGDKAGQQHRKAITALKERLAQPEQEPVGWFTQARNFVPLDEFTKEEAKLYGWNELYLRPPQRTEPICPKCKAEVLYECVACSSNNYPPKENT